MRQRTRADMLAKRHQQPVDVDPLGNGHLFFQYGQGFSGVFSLHIPPAVGYAVHMNIDADRRLSR